MIISNNVAQIPRRTDDAVLIYTALRPGSQDVQTGACSLHGQCLCAKPVRTIWSRVAKAVSLLMTLQMDCHINSEGLHNSQFRPLCLSLLFLPDQTKLRKSRSSLASAIWRWVFVRISLLSRIGDPIPGQSSIVNTTDCPALFPLYYMPVTFVVSLIYYALISGFDDEHYFHFLLHLVNVAVLLVVVVLLLLLLSLSSL